MYIILSCYSYTALQSIYSYFTIFIYIFNNIFHKYCITITLSWGVSPTMRNLLECNDCNGFNQTRSEVACNVDAMWADIPQLLTSKTLTNFVDQDQKWHGSKVARSWNRPTLPIIICQRNVFNNVQCFNYLEKICIFLSLSKQYHTWHSWQPLSIRHSV